MAGIMPNLFEKQKKIVFNKMVGQGDEKNEEKN